MTPVVANTRAELADALKGVREAGGRTAFVPTMGALHEGHAGLLRVATETGAEALVVSVFVNPLQFAPGEDLARYPRTFDADLSMCGDHGVDVVFAPSADEVYPGGEPRVTVDPGPLAGALEGVARPTHFRGVLTVVAKLFGLVGPDFAVFGEKDYQQLVLVRSMVADLCMPVRIVAAPTVREPDGLALSSRNRYLEGEQRLSARALSLALRAGADAASRGAAAVLDSARAVLDETQGLDVDYLELASPELGPVPASGGARLLVAARVGATRLIDNMPLVLGRPQGRAGDTAGSR
jgi:pantoate--beta-alanine ligase